MEYRCSLTTSPPNADYGRRAAKKLSLKPRESVKIVAIDLQPIAPLDGVETLNAEITDPSAVSMLLSALDPEYQDGPMTKTYCVDRVTSDGAPDVTGLHDPNIYVQSPTPAFRANASR